MQEEWWAHAGARPAVYKTSTQKYVTTREEEAEEKIKGP